MDVPEPVQDHAQRIMCAGTEAERAALLTGTVLGVSQGLHLRNLLAHTEAEKHAAGFLAYLGPAPPDRARTERLTNEGIVYVNFQQAA